MKFSYVQEKLDYVKVFGCHAVDDRKTKVKINFEKPSKFDYFSIKLLRKKKSETK